MTARRSSSDPVSHHLQRGERIVWRHRPAGRALFCNRLPVIIIVAAMIVFVIAVGVNVVGASLPLPPIEPSAWLALPAGVMLFFLVLLYFFLDTFWNRLRLLLDSWDTYYALTDRRFIVVSGSRVFDYDASYFHKMEPLGGDAGKQVLMFDWRAGTKRREYYRDRIAGLPDARKLEDLIRATLHA